MEWWVSLLTGGAGVLISLIITFVFNGVINLPARKKKQKAEEEQKQEKRYEEVLAQVNTQIENFRADIREDLASAHEDSTNAHKSIYDELKSQRKVDTEIIDDIKLLKKGLQVTVKNDLKIRYETWIAEGFAPIDAKDDLEKMYQTYHSLGANGVMDSLRAEFMALPLERIAKKKTKTKNTETTTTSTEADN